MPGADEKLAGTRFESIRGQADEVLLGGIFVFDGTTPSAEMNFLTDKIHRTPNPLPVSSTPGLFDNVAKVPPTSNRVRNAADTGDFVAFSFAVDGAGPNTLTVRIATFDETGDSLISVPIAMDIETFVPPFPGFPSDPTFAKTGVAVDKQGRVTVAYTEFNTGVPRVKAQRFDALTGAPIDPAFSVTDNSHGSPDVALLDPAGNRLIVASVDLGNPSTIRGNIVDLSGTTPVVLPEFAISTTPGIVNINPAVAADPTSGTFTVVWENITGVSGDPVNIRARRFDAMGNPVGNDFVVNTTTAKAQGQPAIAYRPGGESVVVWAGDAAVAGDELDVFGQAYDAMGNPIGGEFQVNTDTDGVQDKPTVRFLPEPDAKGQPQFVVAWRDVDQADGAMPNGTGTSYKCFSIGEDPSLIFADGFESGDTSSWSDAQP